MRTRLILLGLLLALAGCRRFRHHGGARAGQGNAAFAAAAGALPAPTTDEERTLYVLGTVLGDRISEFSLSPHELQILQRGMADKIGGQRLLAEPETYGPRLRELARARGQIRSQETRRRGAEFATRAAQEPGAERLASGLVYKELQAGTGPQPTAQDTVSVHYVGTLIDGTEFDSSRRRGQPAEFPLTGVIPCWTEGVQHMHVGGRARLVCPPDIAYGDRAQREIPAGSTLNFEVELISIVPRNAPSGAPSAEPSASAAPPAH